MPYDPSSPPAKTKKLSAAKRRQWVHVFNSCWEKHGDEGKCHAMAWGVTDKSLTPELMKDYVACCVGEVSPAVMGLLKFLTAAAGLEKQGHKYRERKPLPGGGYRYIYEDTKGVGGKPAAPVAHTAETLSAAQRILAGGRRMGVYEAASIISGSAQKHTPEAIRAAQNILMRLDDGPAGVYEVATIIAGGVESRGKRDV